MQPLLATYAGLCAADAAWGCRVPLIEKFPDGYYWARHHQDGSHFIVLRDEGQYYICGVHDAVGREFDPDSQIIMAVPRPVH